MTIPNKSIRLRIRYALLIIIVVALGLLSRRIPLLPSILGDVLWAVMMFFIISFIMVTSRRLLAGCISLSICYLVELSQLYHEPWIDQIRASFLGALILGHGFLWSDMLAYTIGIGMALLVDFYFSNFQSLS